VKTRIIAAALAALVVTAVPACAQSAEIEALRREVAALKEDLANLRSSLGRPRPIIDLKNAPQKGSADALVALIEYSDYECPFCIRHFKETMPLIDKNYIETGKILYSFKDFPIDQLHPQARRAHEATQCVGTLQPAKYWDMHNRMFGAPALHTPEALETTATGLGINAAAYKECLASGRTTAGIRATGEEATAFGANGTPAFFVGIIDKATNQVKITRALSGALPFTQFAQVIEAALAQAKAK
jgi:protein-disulfide isomerase